MFYAFSNDGGRTVFGGLRTELPAHLIHADRATREAEGWFNLDYRPTAHGSDVECICTGFARGAEGFVAQFKLIERHDEEEVTEADKDAALRRFGVEV